ncbi:MAG: hypothetical protein U0324_15890 [Polyangiales bacterium]
MAHGDKRTDEAKPKARRGVDSLSVQAEVHDRQQLELRFNYAVGEHGRCDYHVDAYFFVPRNVGLNRTNYSKEQFYSDFTAYVRVDAAALPLDALADPSNPASPLHRFAATLEALRAAPRPPATRPLSVHARLYANLYVAAVRAECRRLEKLLTRRERDEERTSLLPATASMQGRPEPAPTGPRVADPEGAFERDLAAALARMQEALRAFRSLRGAAWPFEPLCHEGVAEAMRGADEYMSLELEERLAVLSRALGERASRYDGTGFVTRMRAHLAAVARAESGLRARYGHLTLTSRRDPVAPGARAPIDPGEYFTYRASLLKKSVQQALYLNVRGSTRDMFVRNAVGAVAAALAAIWALATQLPAYVSNLSGPTKGLFFAGAVLAYVLKDRIKAVTGEFLLRRARTHDHAHWIYGESLPDLGVKDFAARSGEAVVFLSPEEVPSEVREVRLQRRTVRHLEAAGEEVIHYRKLLTAGDKGAGLPEGYRIRDILRVNLRHFLTRLDDPLDRVDAWDADRGAFVHVELPKVYHLNVVARVRRERVGDAPEVRFAHLRVVLNKDGIVRAEEVRSRRR